MKYIATQDFKWSINYKAVQFFKNQVISDILNENIINEMLEVGFIEVKGTTKKDLVQENKAIESVDENKSDDTSNPSYKPKFKRRGRPPKNIADNVAEQKHVPLEGQQNFA